jgi:hypothetical protein
VEGPRPELRAWVGERLERLESEEDVEALLSEIETEAVRDVASGVHGAGEDILAAVDAWAGLASSVVSRFYAPASPWPRSVAGWGGRAVARLRRICGVLLPALQAGANAVGASSWSVSVGFPWGISVSLTWP